MMTIQLDFGTRVILVISKSLTRPFLCGQQYRYDLIFSLGADQTIRSFAIEIGRWLSFVLTLVNLSGERKRFFNYSGEEIDETCADHRNNRSRWVLPGRTLAKEEL
jgi:hypothetical protein